MRIGLIGCVKGKRAQPAPARDLYTSRLFVGRRSAVETSCDRWYILSAKHGLLHPSTTVEPYDATLNGLSASDRRWWSGEVVEALRTELGTLAGHHFEIHAGSAYVNHGLTEGLRRAGASVSLPVAGRSLGQQLQLYGKGPSATPPGGDGRLDPFQSSRITQPSAPSRASEKYKALSVRICGGTRPMSMTFAEVDEMVGGLPASARRYRAWWANDRSHTQAAAWLDCDRLVVAVDLDAHSVTFG